MLTCLILAWGCGGSDPYAPFKVSEAAFRAQIETLCVQPTEIEFDVSDADVRSDEIGARIVEVLRSAAIAVVDPSITGECWRQTVEAMGGFIDPHHGLVDSRRRKEIRREFWRRLSVRHGCDAVVESTVVTVSTGYRGVLVTWDGLTDYLAGAGGFEGWVTGISVWLAIREMEGNELYFGTGGIGLAGSFINREFGGGTRFEPMPAEDLLRSDRANRIAVELCLAPLVGLPPERDSAAAAGERRIRKEMEAQLRDDVDKTRQLDNPWESRDADSTRAPSTESRP